MRNCRESLRTNPQLRGVLIGSTRFKDSDRCGPTGASVTRTGVDTRTFTAAVPVNEGFHGFREYALSAPHLSTRLHPITSAASHWVLILESDRYIREALRMLLNIGGYEALCAEGLAEATDIARKRSGIELLVLGLPLSCATPADKALIALQEITGTTLNVVVILDDSGPAPETLRGSAHVNLMHKPVSPDALLKILASFPPH